MKPVTVIILTHNEERHLNRAMASVAPFAEKIVVVDSFSSDATVEIARRKGAVVLQHEFVNYAQQFTWALNNAPIATPWVMRLDADELIEPDLAKRISTQLGKLSLDVVGINLKRKHIFMGGWIRHGGRYPLILLRIWRTGQGRIENRWMDEHMVVWGGRTVTLDGGFADHNLNDLTYFVHKHNRYATREAIDVLLSRRKLIHLDTGVAAESGNKQASLKRHLKLRVYERLPFTVSAPLYFLWRYIIQAGFLDGRTGLIYHFMQGFWYRFLIGAKVLELNSATRHLEDKEEFLSELSRLTGLDINSHERV